MTRLGGFIFQIGVAACVLFPTEAAAGQTLRIATRVDATHSDVASGIAFGLAEADRSAQLFGWRVQRISLGAGATDTAARGAYDALIVAGPSVPLPSNVPVLVIGCQAASSAGAFRLSDCRASADSTVVAWDASLERFGAEQLNDRYRAAVSSPMTSEAWTAWFATKVLTEAALRARSSDPSKLLAYLRSAAAQFDGHKGVPLFFDGAGRLVQPLYVVQRTDNGRRVVRELPPRAP